MVINIFIVNTKLEFVDVVFREKKEEIEAIDAKFVELAQKIQQANMELDNNKKEYNQNAQQLQRYHQEIRKNQTEMNELQAEEPEPIDVASIVS